MRSSSRIAEGLSGEVADLGVVALRLEFGDDDDGEHHRVLGEPEDRLRIATAAPRCRARTCARLPCSGIAASGRVVRLDGRRTWRFRVRPHPLHPRAFRTRLSADGRRISDERTYEPTRSDAMSDALDATSAAAESATATRGTSPRVHVRRTTNVVHRADGRVVARRQRDGVGTARARRERDERGAQHRRASRRRSSAWSESRTWPCRAPWR